MTSQNYRKTTDSYANVETMKGSWFHPKPQEQNLPLGPPRRFRGISHDFPTEAQDFLHTQATIFLFFTSVLWATAVQSTFWPLPSAAGTCLPRGGETSQTAAIIINIYYACGAVVAFYPNASFQTSSVSFWRLVLEIMPVVAVKEAKKVDVGC